MTRITRAGSTTSIGAPSWTGSGFAEPLAESYWAALPEVLRVLARAEFVAGNVATEILRNDDRGIILLGFARGPLAQASVPGLIVHTSHAYGNYCYDGTRCTIEDPDSGAFLAFADPDRVEPEDVRGRTV